MVYVKKKEKSFWISLFCGQRWIRTTEVERQQIYSLPHLATLVFALTLFASAKIVFIFVTSKRNPPFLLQ